MSIELHQSIHVDGPFDWSLMLKYVGRRSRDLIDVVEGDEYRRLIVHDGRPLLLRAAGATGSTEIRVSVLGIEDEPAAVDLDVAETALRRVFSLDQSPQGFYDKVRDDPALGPISRQLWGLRPLGSPSIFEMLVNAILGQQISMIAAHAIKERLVLQLGATAIVDGRHYYAFPTPEALAATSEEELVALKFSRRKAEYVRDLAIAIADGRLDLEALRGHSHDEILEYLVGIRGIGRWTAEYVVLRGYGYPDALPAGDAGLRRQVFRYYALPEPPSEAALTAIAEAWRPYRSWATLYLWSAEWAVNPAVDAVETEAVLEAGRAG